jgi:hypothetical protein
MHIVLRNFKSTKSAIYFHIFIFVIYFKFRFLIVFHATRLTKHYYNTPLYQRSVTLCSNGQTARRCCPVATAEHVAHVRLLLVPTAAMRCLTTTDRCYYHQQ